ncbi:MAG TPA: CPBP family intramembrane glutamic endopeptidase [Methanomicrobiales archaeon]|nr:CPBP family intramembrane glutamic endopeptidase [Methanomicrobiales archaeon]
MLDNLFDRDLSHRTARTKVISSGAFLAGLLVIMAAAYSQYLIPLGPTVKPFVVYGIPIVVVSLLWGRTIIARAFHDTGPALEYGIGFYGVFTLLGAAAGVVIYVVLSSFDPNALNLLNRPNPVLNVSADYAWIMVGVSLVVIGPVEEYLFRGFVYGGLLSLFHRHHWFVLAFASALLFGGAHLYYALVYGPASLIAFADLVTFGMAMAVTYYVTGGNLLAPALIHGTYDASAFVGIATVPALGTLLRMLMLLVGILFAGLLYFQRVREGNASPF